MGTITSITTPTATGTPSCYICGNLAHDNILACSKVAEVEYHGDGTIKRVVKTQPDPYWSRGFGPIA